MQFVRDMADTEMEEALRWIAQLNLPCERGGICAVQSVTRRMCWPCRARHFIALTEKEQP
jgi:hypothetical protein